MARRRRGKPLAPDDPRRKGIANLKPIKPGEVRNPEGKNGSEWLTAIRDFFGSASPRLPKGTGIKLQKGDSRFDVLMQALYHRILQGSDASIKLAAEQLAGRARQQIEVSGPGGVPLNGPQVKLYLPGNGRDIPAATEPTEEVSKEPAKEPEGG